MSTSSSLPSEPETHAITRQERIAASILAIANSAFADGLSLGKKVGNVSPIRELSNPVRWEDIPDCSAIPLVLAVSALPEFVVRLRQSPLRSEMMIIAGLFMDVDR